MSPPNYSPFHHCHAVPAGGGLQGFHGLALEDLFAQFFDDTVGAAEGGDKVDQPQFLAGLPVLGFEAARTVGQAPGGVLVEVSPRGEGDGDAVAAEDAELFQHHRRQHQPFQVGHEHVFVDRGAHHQPGDLTQHLGRARLRRGCGLGWSGGGGKAPPFLFVRTFISSLLNLVTPSPLTL